MHTELVNASDRCVQDDILCARLAALDGLPGDGLPGMRFGLKGPRGTLYRVVEAPTLIDAIRLCALLRELGFAHDADCPVMKERRLHRVYQLAETAPSALASTAAWRADRQAARRVAVSAA